MPTVSTVAADRRPALDGLRGVAVAVVVAYHLGGGATSAVAGGYLGVDTFFVLSGYLITSLLLSEHARTGRVDLVAFWARRVRRLFPAAALVLVAIAASVWWFGPVEVWAARRADLLWTLGYAANWHFAAVGEDYFAAYTGASPLRHAWSLAVEEQFYLVWPGLVWLLLSFRGRRRGGRSGKPAGAARAARVARVAPVALVAWVAGLAMAASAVAMALQYSEASPSRAYFGTDGRVQELAVGVLLAVGLGRLPRRALAWAGPVAAVALGAAYLWLPDDSAAFYRGGALAVCLVVAVVVADIELRPGGALARVLAWRPLALLGAISYGVYLWHWPLIVLLPVDGLTGSAWWSRQVVRIALTLSVAALSYVLLEQPVRRGRLPLVGRSTPRLAGAAVVTAAVVVWASVAATAVPAPYAGQLAERSDRPCPGEATDPLASCVKVAAPPGASSPTRSVVLFGDSTARSLDAGLRSWAQHSGGRYVQAAWQRCTPSGLLVVPLGSAAPDDAARTCHDRARTRQLQVLDAERLADTNPLVLVTEYWSHHQGFLIDGRYVAAGTPAHDAALASSYASLIDAVRRRGGRVAFVALPPPGRSLGPFVAAGRPAGLAAPNVPGAEYVDGYNAELRRIAAASGGAAVVLDVADVVCPGGRCDAVQDGTVVRYDGIHYTASYARRLVPVIIARADAAFAP